MFQQIIELLSKRGAVVGVICKAHAQGLSFFKSLKGMQKLEGCTFSDGRLTISNNEVGSKVMFVQEQDVACGQFAGIPFTFIYYEQRVKPHVIEMAMTYIKNPQTFKGATGMAVLPHHLKKKKPKEQHGGISSN